MVVGKRMVTNKLRLGTVKEQAVMERLYYSVLFISAVLKKMPMLSLVRTS